MVANSPGMKDQTSSNIARDGSAKKTQSTIAVKPGMKDQVKGLSSVSPANPGVGPDASTSNPLSPEPKQKFSGPVATSWGMKGKHSPELGSAVLSEAANLGR